MQEIRKKLNSLSDQEYKKFHSSLCPNAKNMIGVRIPELRRMAKEIANTNGKEFLEKYQFEYYEERMLQGFVIGYMQLTIEERIKYLDKFVPNIDNWAVCDCSVSTFKFTKKNMEVMWKYIQKYFNSSKEFEVRFAIVMLLNYYLEEQYIDKALKILNNIKSNKYYVQMAVAWAISIAFVKYKEKTLKFLQNTKLDNFTYNKALQKIAESYRVDKVTKEEIKKMKRK